MKSPYKIRVPYYVALLLAFVCMNNVLRSWQYEFRVVPVKSIHRVGPSLGRMKQLRNSGHILCLKQAAGRREFCEKALGKLPVSKLSTNYTLTQESPGTEFAYRIVHANGSDTPEVVFACACPTEPLGIFVMGWINSKKAVVEVLDYQSSQTAPLDRSCFKGPPDFNITVEDIRKYFMISFENGMKYLLREYDERTKQKAS